MDIITRLFNSFLNIVSAIFFITAIIVFGGMVWSYSSAVTKKTLMSSPHVYNVHTVTERDQNRFSSNNTCWYIETEGKQFHHGQSNAGKNCYVPESIIKNWEEHGENYRKLGFKFWAGTVVFFILGSIVFAWLPTRMMGATPVGAGVALVCVALMGLFTAFTTIQDVRAAYAQPSTWKATVNGKNYSANVKFYLQDRHGTVYTWSSAGTADFSRVSNLGDPATNYVK